MAKIENTPGSVGASSSPGKKANKGPQSSPGNTQRNMGTPPPPRITKAVQKAPSFAETMRNAGVTIRERTRHTPIGEMFDAMERTHINLANRRFIEIYEASYLKADIKSKSEAAGVESTKAAIDSKKEKIVAFEKNTKTFIEGGAMTPKVAKQREKDRAQLSLELEAAQTAHEKAVLKLQKRNDIKAHFENAQRHVAEIAIEKLREKSAPYQEKYDSIKERRDEIFEKIKVQAEKKEAFSKILTDLTKALEAAETKSDKAGFKILIKELRGKIGGVDKKILAYRRQEDAENARLSKAHQRLNKFTIAENEYSRVTQRKRTYTKPPALTKVEPALGKRAAYSFETDLSGLDDEVAKVIQEQETFDSKKITPKEYVEEWNKLFPTEQIPPEVFASVGTMLQRGTKIDMDKKVSGLAVEGYMSAFLIEKARATRRPDPSRENEKKFAQMRQEFNSHP
jgi:hypothetical protein